MTLRELYVQEDCINAISNQSLIFDIDNKKFLADIETLLSKYFKFFNKDLNETQIDNFSVEFWFDSGQLVIYPEKEISGSKLFEFDLDTK